MWPSAITESARSTHSVKVRGDRRYPREETEGAVTLARAAGATSAPNIPCNASAVTTKLPAMADIPSRTALCRCT